MRIPEELVTRQMRRWELDRVLRERFERDETAAHLRRDIITISRERGSGGTLVGKLVAKELDWEFYDRELIHQIAEHLGTDPQHLEVHDERAPNFMQDLLLQVLEGHRPTESQYLRMLVQVLRAIRARGQAVIMGRGAHLVLPDALRVRLVAPLDLRVERIAELEDRPVAEAHREVLSVDRQRAQFVRGHFGMDPHDPDFYDLVVNTGGMSLDHAAQLVICALRNRQQAAQEGLIPAAP